MQTLIKRASITILREVIAHSLQFIQTLCDTVSQKKKTICTMLDQRRIREADVVYALCYTNVMCLLGCGSYGIGKNISLRKFKIIDNCTTRRVYNQVHVWLKDTFDVC